MTLDGTFRRRHLPHWDVDGKPVFVTACLEGSISAVGLSRIRQYRHELERRPRPQRLSGTEWEIRKHKLVFRLVDELLDHQSPVRHLEDERQAKIVHDAFLYFADERYTLFAFVIMPSHHHWLFLPNETWSQSQIKKTKQRTPRETISQSVQSYTGMMCNRILRKSGAYWQTETFDHWARDEAEMHRIIRYIEENPVKAGLVERPRDWRWSSARIRARKGLGVSDPIRRIHAE